MTSKEKPEAMNRSTRLAAACVTSLLLSTSAHAGQTWQLGHGASFTLGAGLRMYFRDTDGNSESDIDSARIYMSGQLTKTFGFTFNPDVGRDEDGDIDRLRAYDAHLRFEPSDYLNVWAGRIAMPTDRANIAGPYFISSWDFPIANQIPSYVAGRDNGVVLWGQEGKGRLKYQIGAFQGCNDDSPCATGANKDDNPLFNGRLSYAFWDPEPGYYLASDYYGEKEILSVGLSGTHQKDATGIAGDSGDYTSVTFDILMQKKIANGGVITFDGAYYYYDTDDKITPLASGTGFYVLSSYLFPEKIGIGQFQPMLQYQKLNRDDGGADMDKLDASLHYIIKGHDARVSAVYSHTTFDDDQTEDFDSFLLGMQLQY